MQHPTLKPVVKFAGQTITLGGTDFVIPPLSFRILRDHQALLTATTIAEHQSSWDYMLERLPIIHAALVRNYPEMTIEEVADLVDLSNFNDVFAAVMNVSGVKAKESTATGESQPAQALE